MVGVKIEFSLKLNKTGIRSLNNTVFKTTKTYYGGCLESWAKSFKEDVIEYVHNSILDKCLTSSVSDTKRNSFIGWIEDKSFDYKII